jgi:hypothetical protein
MLLVIVFDARAFGGQAVPAQDRLFPAGISDWSLTARAYVSTEARDAAGVKAANAGLFSLPIVPGDR